MKELSIRLKDSHNSGDSINTVQLLVPDGTPVSIKDSTFTFSTKQTVIVSYPMKNVSNTLIYYYYLCTLSGNTSNVLLL